MACMIYDHSEKHWKAVFENGSYYGSYIATKRELDEEKHKAYDKSRFSNPIFVLTGLPFCMPSGKRWAQLELLLLSASRTAGLFVHVFGYFFSRVLLGILLLLLDDIFNLGAAVHGLPAIIQIPLLLWGAGYMAYVPMCTVLRFIMWCIIVNFYGTNTITAEVREELLKLKGWYGEEAYNEAMAKYSGRREEVERQTSFAMPRSGGMTFGAMTRPIPGGTRTWTAPARR